MKYALLASGSKGNCCVIEHHNTQIVIDCGSTKRYLTQSFEQLELDYKTSDAILITHTHQDHVAQIKMFNDIPTYATQEIVTDNLFHIEPFEKINCKDFSITVLPMSHDCENTVGYVMECDEGKMVYITDTGYIKNEVKPFIQNADYYVFESNHDIEMLMGTNRPVYIKQRIINDNGHLCNDDAANILSEVIGENTKEIVLAHISQEGNTRQMAYDTMKQTLQRHGVFRDDIRLFPAEQFGIYKGGKR